MDEIIEINGVECRKKNGLFLINNVDIAVLSEKFEDDEHALFIENSNVYALKHTTATYKSAENIHTTILVPTTQNTGTYLIINEGFSLTDDTFDTTSLANTDKVLVVVNLDQIGRSDQINRGMIDGVAYIDEPSITEMEHALDM